MTVYPLTINIGSFQITGFGLMMMTGFLMAGWAVQKNLQSRGHGPAYAEHIVVAAVIGGILGAKLWYVALNQDFRYLFTRGGLVWYGGFIGGMVFVLANGWRVKVPTRFTLEITAPALALGHSLGRLGCFLIQDDYGIPTSLPWGMKFPQGYPATTAQNLQAFGVNIPAGVAPNEILAVHPTQLYEVAALMFVFWLLWRLRRHEHAVGWLFAAYLIAEGIERFLIEFIRAKDDRVLGAFTVSQAMSVAAILAGIVLMAIWWKRDDFALPKSAAVLAPQPPSTG